MEERVSAYMWLVTARGVLLGVALLIAVPDFQRQLGVLACLLPVAIISDHLRRIDRVRR